LIAGSVIYFFFSFQEWPIAMALDPTSGQLFLLDSSSAIFRLDFRVGIVSLIAGSQRSCENGDDSAIEAIAFCPLHGALYMIQRNGKGKGHLVCFLRIIINNFSSKIVGQNA
jgi:hypothetical protein